MPRIDISKVVHKSGTASARIAGRILVVPAQLAEDVLRLHIVVVRGAALCEFVAQALVLLLLQERPGCLALGVDCRLDLARVNAGVVIHAVDRAQDVAAALLLACNARFGDRLQVTKFAEDVVGVVLDRAGDVICDLTRSCYALVVLALECCKVRGSLYVRLRSRCALAAIAAAKAATREEQEKQRDQNHNTPSAKAIVLVHDFTPFRLEIIIDRRFRAVSLANLADKLTDRLIFICLKPCLKTGLRGQKAKYHLRTLSLQRRFCRLQQAVQELVSPGAAAHQGHNRILH